MAIRTLHAVLILLMSLLAAPGMLLAADSSARANLIKAILTEDASEQAALIRDLANAPDPLVEQALGAWRLGSLYIHEGPGGSKIPFLLDPTTDAEGKARGLQLPTSEPLKDSSGKTLLFAASELTPADTTSKLRKVIKTTLDLYALANPNPRQRRDAVVKIGQEQNADYIPFLEARLKNESDKEVRKSLVEAVALTRIASEDASVRAAAVTQLGEIRSIQSVTFLQKLLEDVKAGRVKDEATVTAVKRSLYLIENYIWWGNLYGTAFRGFSLSAVLLLAALGLAITFGLMGVINMAHGEVMMVGAYTAYVVQNIFKSAFGASGAGFDSYFPAALAASFFSAGLVGLALERGIIRFLYKRPLESMLATWGVSLLLQQIFRHIFGAANVQVSSPSWLSGSFVTYDVLLAYNRLFVIAFAILVVFGTWLLLVRTSVGLQIRAVMQNRAMASCVGVRTDRVNMLTFMFGSGLAGMAGACLSQIGNVGPSLGQNHIVDCFMIVVMGGVGNLMGTVFASLGVGVTDQILQPWLGAVMGKITVLAAIILFLQWRPAGLFVTRSRSLEG